MSWFFFWVGLNKYGESIIICDNMYYEVLLIYWYDFVIVKICLRKLEGCGYFKDILKVY